MGNHKFNNQTFDNPQNNSILVLCKNLRIMQLLQISTGDLQRFLDAPELLGESEEMQIAIATFPETPRSLLAVLVNSDYSTVAESSETRV